MGFIVLSNEQRKDENFIYQDYSRKIERIRYNTEYSYRNNICYYNINYGYGETKKYLKKIAKKIAQIQIDQKIMSGMPVIANTRIPVSLIIACLKDEMSFDEICEEYHLTEEQIVKAMEYIIEILDSPYCPKIPLK